MKKTVVGLAIGMLALGFAGGFASGWGYNNSSFHAAETTPLTTPTSSTTSSDNSLAAALDALIVKNILTQVSAQNASAFFNLPLKLNLTNFLTIPTAKAQGSCLTANYNLGDAMDKAFESLLPSSDLDGCAEYTMTETITDTYYTSASNPGWSYWQQDRNFTLTIRYFDEKCQIVVINRQLGHTTVIRRGKANKHGAVDWFNVPGLPSDAIKCGGPSVTTKTKTWGLLDKTKCPYCKNATPTPVITPGG